MLATIKHRVVLIYQKLQQKKSPKLNLYEDSVAKSMPVNW